MRERVSEFPDRRSVLRDGQKVGRPPQNPRKRLTLPILILFAAAYAGYRVYDLQDVQFSPWQQLQQLGGLIPGLESPPAGKRQIAPRIRAKQPDMVKRRAQAQIRPFSKPQSYPGFQPKQAEQTKRAGVTQAGEVQLPVGKGFRPVGFSIPAVSKSLPFGPRPGKLHRRLPEFKGPAQKYGEIRLAGGQVYAFVLDTAPNGYELYVDRNRNGDLSDDGAPLQNRGKGRFANTLSLPLDRVTGIAALKGEYELWIYSNPQGWTNGHLEYYSRTQLSARLQLEGVELTAYLADNLELDGNFTNDGISIDLDGDGSIDRQREYYPPGKQVVVNGRSYLFRIVP